MRLLMLVVASLQAWAPVALGCDLPWPVRERVGRAQTFTYRTNVAEYDALKKDRDYVWSDTGPRTSNANPHFAPGVFSSIYTAARRVPAYGYGPNFNTVVGHTLEWFRSNHPDWIVYKCDGVTPAYEYADQTYVPIDISNPTVRKWRLDNEIDPLLSVGYGGISVDNIYTDNAFGSCGTYSGPAGKWVRRYTGERYGDAVFSDDQLTWLEELRAFVHERGKGCVSANISFRHREIRKVTQFARAVDIVFDEGGFNGPEALCQIGGGDRYRLVGEEWLNKFRFFAGLRQPFVLGNNGLCSQLANRQENGVVDWALASYLVVKNDRSYIGWVVESSAKFEDVQRFNIEPGRPEEETRILGTLAVRRFAKALVVLNFSTVSPAALTLDRDDYFDSKGRRRTGSIRLPEKSALILTIKE